MSAFICSYLLSRLLIPDGFFIKSKISPSKWLLDFKRFKTVGFGSLNEPKFIFYLVTLFKNQKPMEDISIFADKAALPSEEELAEKLGTTYPFWKQLEEFVMLKYPGGMKQWSFPGKKYGWNYRIKDKKRAIIYLLPRENFFKVAFVFGQKASIEVWESDVSVAIKTDLANAIKYAEGRGIRIDVKDEAVLPDIKRLVEIKLSH